MDQKKAVGMALRGDLTIGRCAVVRNSLLQHLGKYEAFEVILDPEPAIDSAGLQLLISLKKEMKQRGKGFRFRSIPGSVRSFADSIGVDIYASLESE